MSNKTLCRQTGSLYHQHISGNHIDSCKHAVTISIGPVAQDNKTCQYETPGRKCPRPFNMNMRHHASTYISRILITVDPVQWDRGNLTENTHILLFSWHRCYIKKVFCPYRERSPVLRHHMIYCSLNTCFISLKTWFHGSLFFLTGVPFRRKGAVRCRYNAVDFLQNAHKIHPHGLPVRARFGVFFVSSKSDLCSGVTVVIAVLYEISWYIVPRYSGTELYWY